MNIKKLSIVAVLALLPSLAFAGLTRNVPVESNLNPDGSGGGAGNMTTARFSNNTIEYIGCGTRNFDFGDGNLFTFGFCQAGDSAGTEVFCSTENPAIVESIRAISDFSFITFRFNTNGNCEAVGFSTQSFYIPGEDDEDHDEDD